MRASTVMPWLALALAVALAGWAQGAADAQGLTDISRDNFQPAPLQDPAAGQAALSPLAWVAVGPMGAPSAMNCSVVCNGEAEESNLPHGGPAPPKEYTCWGQLSVSCSSSDGAAVSGFGCVGLYKMYAFDKVISTCDGGFGWVAGHVTPEPDGSRTKRFEGAWGGGMSAYIMDAPPKSAPAYNGPQIWVEEEEGEEGPCGSETDSLVVDISDLVAVDARVAQEAPAQRTSSSLPASAARRLMAAGGEEMVEALARLEAAPKASASTAAAHRACGGSVDTASLPSTAPASAPGKQFRSELRVAGVAGEWRVQKRAEGPTGPGMEDGLSAAPGDGQDASRLPSPAWDLWMELEAEAEEPMEDSGVQFPWPRAPGQPAAHPHHWHHHAHHWHTKGPRRAGRCGEGRGGEHFRGGDFSVQCNGQPAWLHGMFPCRGNLTVQATFTPGPHTPAQQLPAGEASATAGEHYMRAECDGFWSGVLGRTCYGITTSNVKVAPGPGSPPAGASAMPGVDKWDVCSGRKSVWHKGGHGGWGMGSACKGTSVASMKLSLPAQQGVA